MDDRRSIAPDWLRPLPRRTPGTARRSGTSWIALLGLGLGLGLNLGLGLGLGCRGDDTQATDTADSDTASTDTDTDTADGSETDTDTDTADLPSTPTPATIERWVHVTLDGADLEGATVIQGGVGLPVFTDAEGRAVIEIDTTIPGDLALMASHPLSRTRGQFVVVDDHPDEVLVYALVSTELGDNEAYLFNPPGIPGVAGNTLECGHCHTSMKEDWHASPHRRSASNPVVQDIYAGTAAALDTQVDCEAAGGQWWIGLVPGSEDTAPRCYLGAGTLPDLNEDCGDEQACDQIALAFGQCADCHAPAIDGVLGGRDLLAATGTSYEAGVHCDLCHKVESVDMGAGPDAPGVAGRLAVHRPLEPAANAGVGVWAPLSFGPYADVPNPRMGASQRAHFREAEFCGGCHQHDQAALVPGTSLDPTRWPSARLPTHSTYEEWRRGPFEGVAPCSSCHMPADPSVGNGADLEPENIPFQGIARGWLRPPGSVRAHSWVGPRNADSGMLQLAAALFIDKSIEGGTLEVQITVRNVGAGHAIPTGEPMRALILVVQARCGDQVLTATGGDAVPAFGGWLDAKPSPEDWQVWPGAAVGDLIRVVDDLGFIDYEGFGRFGPPEAGGDPPEPEFTPSQKGLPRLEVIGETTVIAVDGDQVTLSAPLPPGDLAYRGRPSYFALGEPALDDLAQLAGAPGFAFARVLVDDQGTQMVPHHRATDLRSDNRILPQHEFSSTHRFASICADPVVDAVLIHRPYPVALAEQRGWDNNHQIMAEVSK